MEQAKGFIKVEKLGENLYWETGQLSPGLTLAPSPGGPQGEGPFNSGMNLKPWMPELEGMIFQMLNSLHVRMIVEVDL